MILLIFFFSGLIIETDQIRSGIRDIKATAAAIVAIIFFSPIAALGLTHLPLETGVLLGIILVAAMPTTLSSGVVMTGQAGGNMAHALFVTILSNCLAIISIPLVLPLLLLPLDLKTDPVIDQYNIFFKLVILVLLPLIVGLLIKQRMPAISVTRKKQLGMLNQCIVICIIFISLSGVRNALIDNSATLWSVILLVTVFHLILLAFTFGISRLLKIGPGRREAVIFMGSQKTLPLSIVLQMACFPTYGSVLLVCVIHHIIHLMIDGYLAVKLRE